MMCITRSCDNSIGYAAIACAGGSEDPPVFCVGPAPPPPPPPPPPSPPAPPDCSVELGACSAVDECNLAVLFHNFPRALDTDEGTAWLTCLTSSDPCQDQWLECFGDEACSAISVELEANKAGDSTTQAEIDASGMCVTLSPHRCCCLCHSIASCPRRAPRRRCTTC